MVSTFGVERMKTEPGVPEGAESEFDWSRFRTFARLDKKTDESLSRYFRSFVAMCRRVCHLRQGRDEGNRSVHSHTEDISMYGPLLSCSLRDYNSILLSPRTLRSFPDRGPHH